MSKLPILTALLLGLAVAGAAAQAPVPIAPPGAQQEWERAERAREQLRYQRERDQLDLERRRLQNQQLEQGRDILGAPTYVAPAPIYGAPQYPTAAPGYGTAYPAPNYGPAAGGPAYAPPGTARICQQSVPAYNEAGRFLANVCVR